MVIILQHTTNCSHMHQHRTEGMKPHIKSRARKTLITYIYIYIYITIVSLLCHCVVSDLLVLGCRTNTEVEAYTALMVWAYTALKAYHAARNF